MNEVDSPTRGDRIGRHLGGHDPCPAEYCCAQGHPSLEEAFACGRLQGRGADDMSLKALDWAFGLRASVPTFGNEWVRAAVCRARFRDEDRKNKQEAGPCPETTAG